MSYARLHEGTWWVDARVTGYYSLPPTPSGDVGIPGGASAGWGCGGGPRTWTPANLGSRSSSSSAKPAVRAGATKAFREPTSSCLEVQGPVICKTLKGSRGPKGKKSGVKDQRAGWPKEAPRACLPVPGGDAGTKVSGRHQRPVQDPALGAPPASRALQTSPTAWGCLGCGRGTTDAGSEPG